MPNVNGGAHKPELDNMTPAMIRVLCEELLYTMDCDQRRKIAKKIPGIYKMVYGSLPDAMVNQTANQIVSHLKKDSVNPEDVYEVLKKVGL